MNGIKRTIGRRAARATVRHTARGLASRAVRRPLRSVTLVGFGMVLGAGAGWLTGRRV